MLLCLVVGQGAELVYEQGIKPFLATYAAQIDPIFGTAERVGAAAQCDAGADSDSDADASDADADNNDHTQRTQRSGVYITR